MIQSYKCKHTEALHIDGKSGKFPTEVIKTAMRKLDYLDAAIHIEALRVPPGNRLEKLSGSYDGFYSIRINDQWRLVFKFENSHAYEVQIIDYH